ncbi:MAG: DUF2793 domain-containing protein, partial [Methylobacteriaceae bacterium]|nr:DUF2793 domain-containing protein [Methylobacteriaceae bacterium]
MADTTRLQLPYLDAAQAQKHATHNEALRRLDALVQLAVIERRASPPAAPAEGARYLVDVGASGAFAGHDGEIAAFDDGAFVFLTPRAGWILFIEAEQRVFVRVAGVWAPIETLFASLSTFAAIGVGTAASPANPFLAQLNDALFDARPVGAGGSGDLRVKFNKASAAATGSLIFQQAFSARAEFGLVGDDDVRLKVSPDGAAWSDVFEVDRVSGAATFARSPRRARQVAIFTANGTYAVPVWARALTIVAIGGGGGGGSGGAGDATAARFGGGGGGAGARVEMAFDVAELGASLTVTVGAGGAGGAAVAGAANGLAGADGGASQVADGATTLLLASGGNRGSGGTTSGAGGAAQIYSWPKIEGAGGASSATATAAAGAASAMLAGGGGGGGGLDAASVARAGGAGGIGAFAHSPSRRSAGGAGGGA